MFGRTPPPPPGLSLKPLWILGGYNAAELWPLTNLVLPAWLLLVFLPTWKHTRGLTIIVPLMHAAMYVAGLLSGVLNAPEGDAGPDFTTLEGVYSLFQDPSVVFVGWLHYLVFDLLVGRGILEDALTRNWTPLRHALLVVPCLFFTLMLGPTGFLIYVCVTASGLLGPKVTAADLERRLQRLKAL